MDKWVRIVANGTADTGSNDTTETQVGAGVSVPTWAKSAIQGVFALGDLTQTTAESVSGYARVYNDNGTIEPLYMPLPVIGASLAGAAAGQLHFPTSFPILQNVEPNDYLRLGAAFDIATTGVHLLGGYVLFSDKPVSGRIHCQKMAYTAIPDDISESSVVDIKTLAGKTSKLLGILGYAVIGGTAIAAESGDSYLRVKSDAAGWQEQQLALNHENASLGADSYQITQPVSYVYKDVWGIQDYFDGFHKRVLGMSAFPVKDIETFKFSAHNTRDVGDTMDRGFRGFLLWQE